MTGPVVIYDGVCNLCNESVNFIIRRERSPVLKFSPSQSDYARNLVDAAALSRIASQSVILYRDGRIYTGSDAVVELAHYLKWPWSMLRHLAILPVRLRETAYRLIADNRYRIFGKSETCIMPDKSLLDRFIGLNDGPGKWTD